LPKLTDAEEEVNVGSELGVLVCGFGNDQRPCVCYET
jgi:hypothetical protein